MSTDCSLHGPPKSGPSPERAREVEPPKARSPERAHEVGPPKARSPERPREVEPPKARALEARPGARARPGPQTLRENVRFTRLKHGKMEKYDFYVTFQTYSNGNPRLAAAGTRSYLHFSPLPYYNSTETMADKENSNDQEIARLVEIKRQQAEELDRRNREVERLRLAIAAEEKSIALKEAQVRAMKRQ